MIIPYNIDTYCEQQKIMFQHLQNLPKKKKEKEKLIQTQKKERKMASLKISPPCVRPNLPRQQGQEDQAPPDTEGHMS